MDDKTEERLHKYPTSHRDPKPDCRFCGGAGERFIKKLNLTTCCICIFVDHEFCEGIGIQLGDLARRELEK